MTITMIRNARLGTGIIQGILLYLLYRASEHTVWPATDAHAFVPLVLIAVIVPIIVAINIGSMQPKVLAAWTLMASAFLWGLGLYDVIRRGQEGTTGLLFSTIHNMPSAPLVFFIGAGVFITQSLIAAADLDGKRIASYPRYFDVAWKLAIQINFSIVFVAAFWLVMSAGVALFALVKITFLADLMKHSWFNIPVTTLAFSYAIHITDVRANLVRGIRTLKLVLLSWLLPIMVFFVAIFVVDLPFQGLAILWATHHTSQILLGTAVWLILLINAAYHDGTEEHRPGKFLQYAGIVGSVLLFPLVGIAFYALILRVVEYGWTVNIIDVCACLIVAACYAVGYLSAVFTRGAWLKRLEITNIYTSFVILVVLLALFTPLADPARLSVADQLGRLESGKVTADKFDYTYLKRQGASFGEAALTKMKNEASGSQADVIKEKAADALRNNNPWTGAITPQVKDLAENITVYPAGHTLPDNFLKKDWNANGKPHPGIIWPPCFTMKTAKCDAYVIDAAENVPQQIIVAGTFGFGVVFKADGDDWVPVGQLSGRLNCKGVRDALHAGSFKLESATAQEIVVNDVHIQVNQDDQCPDQAK